MTVRVNRSPLPGHRLAAFLAALAVTALAHAQHPGPQPRPAMSSQTTSPDGSTTFVNTTAGLFRSGDSELPYVESDMRDAQGLSIPNTLPSRPANPFNLHAAAVRLSSIDKTSPRDDLRRVIDDVRSAARKGFVDRIRLQQGIDILEGNPLPGKVYSGFAMLHYTAAERVKRVEPVRDAQGQVIGGNVTVRQIWFDNQIESDTALIDPSEVQNVPWTVTYVIDVLNGGADDFSPFGMFFDAPAAPGSFGDAHFGIDQTFYPMSEGQRHLFTIKHPPARYYKLTYTWGWRKHPPRIQAMENALQSAGGIPLLQWETQVFGTAPRSSEASRMAAIAQIGDLSPAKRMWRAFRDATSAPLQDVVRLMDDARLSFEDWSDRTRLPRGVTSDPTADATFFYVNNTMYGDVRNVERWSDPGAVFKVALLNGDRFAHAYMAVDFGGIRGWENQFHTAGGSAASHTFGRAHWWPVAGPIMVPPVSAMGLPGRHRVEMTLNFKPGDRIKLYQFDPLHHDVAIYSLH